MPMTAEELAAAIAEAEALAAAAEAHEGTDEEKAAARATADAKFAEVEDAKKAIKDKEEADKNKPTDETARLLQDVMKWKAKARQAEEKAKLFEGLDPAKARAALAEQEAAERKELEARGEYDRILAQVNEQHQAALTTVTTERDGYKAEIETLKAAGKSKDLANTFANSTFIRDNLTINGQKSQVLYGSHFEWNADGELVGYDKPAGASQRTPLVDAQGKNLPFEAAIEKIVKADPDVDSITKSTIRRGPGAAPAPLAPSLRTAPETSQEKIALGLASLAKKKPLLG